MSHRAPRAMRQTVVVLALAAMARAAPVAASPLFELVGDADGTGGFNARAGTPSAASTYFNPALLADAPRGLSLGIFVVGEDLGVTLDARNCGGTCDVPVVFGTGPESYQHEDGSPLSDPTVPTTWLENGRDVENGLAPRPRQGGGTGHNLRAYQVIGLVSPIFGARLVLGFYAMIPLSEFTTARAFYNDEREQYFSNSLHPEMYSDRLTATSLAFGVGSRVSKRLALGLTFTLNLKNRAAAPVYVSNLSNLDTVLLDSDIGVKASVAPHFGAAFRATRRLGLAATLHTPQSFKIDTGFDYILSTGSEQGATVSFTHAYMPLKLAVGGTFELGTIGDHRLSVAATTEFARWSQYVDRHSERPHPDYAWSDTLTGAIGLRDAVGALHASLDLAYQPTPVPAQTGRSNYVDNDRLGVAGGLTWNFKLFGSRFTAGAHAQLHRLLARHVTKFAVPDNPQPNPNLPGFGDNYYPQLVRDEVPDDAVDSQLGDPIPNRDGLQTNNPGWPGFGSEGWILGGGLSLAVVY